MWVFAGVKLVQSYQTLWSPIGKERPKTKSVQSELAQWLPAIVTDDQFAQNATVAGKDHLYRIASASANYDPCTPSIHGYSCYTEWQLSARTLCFLLA